MSWLVYRLTGSALLLGLVSFWGQLPTFLLAPFAGLIADRFNRHRLVILLQTLAMLQALVLATLVLTNLITINAIVVLGILLGLINAFEIPIRQSFVVEMIDKKEDLPNAIALNSSMVNGARLLGPSIAGLITSAIGEGMCFLVNGLSYIAVLASLLMMKIAPKVSITKNKKIFHDLKEGFRYAFSNKTIRDLILLLALSSLMGMPYQILMPVLAKNVLGGGANTLGFLMGASGAGALVGAYFLARRKDATGLISIVPICAIVFGLAIIMLSLSTNFFLSCFILLFAGFGMMVQMASTNTILQVIVPDEMRGRVMSIYTMAFMGMGPFGSLLAGGMASHFGTERGLMIGGMCCVVGGVVFKISRRFRVG